MPKKMSRDEAKKKIQELEDSIEKFREKTKAEMLKLADEYDLSFFYQGEGRYYAGPLSLKDDDMEEDWVEDGWHSSACY